MTYISKHMVRTKPRGMGDGEPADDIITLLFGELLPADQAPPTDNVNQTTGGGASTSASDFTSAGGVCKPMNFPALAASRALQSQLNRVAQVKGFGKVATDGAIGPGTLALFREVQALSAGGVMGDPSSCMGVAPDVDVLAAQVQALADSLGAPATVSGPVLSLSVPSIKTKSGKTVVAPDAGLLGGMASLSAVEKLALLGVAGGIGYLLLSKSKKRRK